MARTVFWSWQSDTDERVTRHLIREALMIAIDRSGSEMDEADRPEIDHDTKGVTGTPDIVSTILAKIDDAAVFVADVTPIVKTAAGKHLPNPNVMIELGYAKKAVTTDRIIQIWNTCFTSARPEDLPFDMRGRRAPITYSLAPGATKAELKVARQALVDQLSVAIASILALSSNRREPASLPWFPSEPDDRSLWEGGSEPFVLNRREGSKTLQVHAQRRGYARVLPARHVKMNDAREILSGETSHPFPLGDFHSLDWGNMAKGFLVHRSDKMSRNNLLLVSATRWFETTGEFWGIDGAFVYGGSDDPRLSTTYLIERWYNFLRHHIKIVMLLGGTGPFHVRLGIEGLNNVAWPPSEHPMSDDVITEALEGHFTFAATLADGGHESILATVREAFLELGDVFGLRADAEDAFQEVVARLH